MSECEIRAIRLETTHSLFTAICETHGTTTITKFLSATAAVTRFQCDPKNRRFLVVDNSSDVPGVPIPFMLDLSGLADLIHQNYYHEYYSFEGRNYHIQEILVQQGEFFLKPLEVSVQIGKFNANDYRDDVVSVFYAGEQYLDGAKPVVSVFVVIDGRA